MATSVPLIHAVAIAGVDAQGVLFLISNRGFSRPTISGNDITLVVDEPLAQGESLTLVTSMNDVTASLLNNPVSPPGQRVVRLGQVVGGAMFMIQMLDMRGAVGNKPIPVLPVGPGSGAASSVIGFFAGENSAPALRDLVWVDAPDDVAPALASAANRLPAVGFVAAIDTSLPRPFRVQYAGELGGFSGLVTGAQYYASDSVPGGITLTPPTTIGAFVQPVAVAKDATTLIVNPDAVVPVAIPITGANYTGTGPLALNDVVYVDSANDVARADASNALKMPAVGFVAAIDLSLPLPYRVQYFGELDGFSGLVPGVSYYVSEAVPGQITSFPPATIGNFVQSVGVAKNPTTLIVNPEPSIVNPAPPSGYPVSDAIFGIKNALDPLKLLIADLAGQATGTTTTLTTTAQVSRPFKFPDISGTAVVQEDVTGFVLMGSNVTLHASNAGMQFSTLTANRAQLRTNQYGANTGVPGLTSFKSRGATIGSLVALLPSDVLFRATAIGVTPNLSIPLAGFITIQVPAAFVAAGQSFMPSEYELQLTPLNGLSARQVVAKVTGDGETQTLRGVRAGGPATSPANLTTGTLWSSGVGSPEGVIVGSPGDLYSNTSGALGTTFYEKTSGVGTNTGWVADPDSGSYTSGVALALNDLVYVSGADAVLKADASASTKMPAIGFVSAINLALARPYVVKYGGELGGFVGLTSGATYYASSTTPGGIVLTPPLSGIVQVVGVAKDATTLVVTPEIPVAGLMSFTGGEVLAIRDLVYVDVANDLKKADFSLTSKMPAIGFVVAIDLTAALPYKVQSSGELGGFAGLTANNVYYASSAGGITRIIPTTGLVQVVGIAKNTTTLIVSPEIQVAYGGAQFNSRQSFGFHSTTGPALALHDCVAQFVGGGTGIVKADASSRDRMPAIGFVSAIDLSASLPYTVQYSGQLGGFAGVSGGPQYVSATVPGAITNLIPSAGYKQVVGSTSASNGATFIIEMGSSQYNYPVQYSNLTNVDYSNATALYTDVLTMSVAGQDPLGGGDFLIDFSVSGECFDGAGGAAQANFRVLVDGVAQFPQTSFTGGGVSKILGGGEGVASASATIKVLLLGAGSPHAIKLQAALDASAPPGSALTISTGSTPESDHACMTITPINLYQTGF